MGIDKRELAIAILEWEVAQARADELRKSIEDTVLQLGETITVGNVVAQFRKGRKAYNYQEVGKDASEELVEQYKKVSVSVDWRKLVLEGMKAKMESIPYTEGSPSASLKIVKS